jgi:hypothetical protein
MQSSTGEQESKSDIITVDCYNFDAVKIIHIPFLQGNNQRNNKDIQTHNVFIIDRSGSMGQWVRTIIESIKKVVIDLDKKVRIITFDSETELIKVNRQSILSAANIRELSISARGCTKMATVFDQLINIYNDVDQNDTIRLFVVSDGGVSDIDDVIRYCDHFITQNIMRPGATTVTSIRLMIGGVPDTRALSCFCALNTRSSVSVLDIDPNIVPMLPIILAYLEDRTITTEYNLLKSNTSILYRMPGDPLQDSLLVRNNEYVFLTSDICSLSINEQPIILNNKNYGEIDIAPFLELLSSVCRNIMVIHRNNSSPRLLAIRSILEAIKQTIDRNSSNTEHSYDIRSRIHQQFNRLKKTTSTIDNILAMINNQDLITSLMNQQTAANFLRGDITTKLAKRINKLDQGTPDEMVNAGMHKLFDKLPDDIGRIYADITSFLSTEGYDDIIPAIKNMREDMRKNSYIELTVKQVLSIIGALGVCINMKQGTYVDPWQAICITVYPGTYLSEACIFNANNDGFVLQVPGAGNKAIINATIPIREFCPNFYDAYSKTDIANIHTSIAMRNSIAPLPDDQFAMIAAALVCLINKISLSRISEIEEKTLTWLKNNCIFRLSKSGEKYNTITNALNTFDPRPSLNGENDISGILKITMLLLVDPALNELRSDLNKLNILLAVFYELKAYCAAKYILTPETRLYQFNDLIDRDTLELDSNRRSPVGDIGDDCNIFVPPSEDDLDKYYKKIIEKALNLEWLPSIDNFLAIRRFASDESILLYSSDAFITTEQIAIAGFMALYSNCESDRIDKELMVSKIPHPALPDNGKSFIYNYIIRQCRKSFDHLTYEKNAIENDIRMNRLVETLISDSIIEFRQRIPELENRENIYYTKLVNQLISTENNMRCEKLLIIILGCDLEGNLIWCNGNSIIGNLQHFAKIFEDENRLGMWNAITNIIRGKHHMYRNVTINRHGHGNNKPSYWALRFKSIDEMKETVTPEVWQEYCNTHINCCGFKR